VKTELSGFTPQAASQLVLAQHWFEELKRLVPQTLGQ